MEKIQVEQELENRRLEQTLAIVEEQLAAARLRSEDNKAEILAAKQEMREDTSYSISGLWSMDNFHALVELSQYANPVSAKVSEYERDANRILILEKLLDSPYFARLDFKFADEESPEQIYIGRSSLQDDKTHDITTKGYSGYQGIKQVVIDEEQKRRSSGHPDRSRSRESRSADH